jgi:hypothetical protein
LGISHHSNYLANGMVLERHGFLACIRVKQLFVEGLLFLRHLLTLLPFSKTPSSFCLLEFKTLLLASDY